MNDQIVESYRGVLEDLFQVWRIKPCVPGITRAETNRDRNTDRQGGISVTWSPNPLIKVEWLTYMTTYVGQTKEQNLW